LRISTTSSSPSKVAFSDALVSALADARVSRLTLAVLEDFVGCADDHGWCWPKLKTLAARRGMTLKAYSKHVAKLKEGGHLYRGMRHDHGGYWWLVANTQREVALTVGTPSRLPGRLLYSTCSGTTPPLTAGEEEPQMNYIDLRELEGVSDLPEDRPHPQARPPAKPKKSAPPKLNAYALAEKFCRRHRGFYPGVAPPSRAMLGKNFAHWHREGVSYEIIDTAIDLFFASVQATLFAPADRVFIKQRFQWIDQAAEIYFREVELPRFQREDEEQIEGWYARIEAVMQEIDPTARFRSFEAAEQLLASAGRQLPDWRG
jgi:hypothetical protein